VRPVGVGRPRREGAVVQRAAGVLRRRGVAGAGEGGGGLAHRGHGEARVVVEAHRPVGVDVGELDLDGVEGGLGPGGYEAQRRVGHVPALVLHLRGLQGEPSARVPEIGHDEMSVDATCS
jgi:hypothetical protein